jgi:hypothetical protein
LARRPAAFLLDYLLIAVYLAALAGGMLLARRRLRGAIGPGRNPTLGRPPVSPW